MIAQKDNTVKFGITQYDASRFAIARVVVCVVLAVSLLVAPIFVLSYVDMRQAVRVCAVCVFMVLFAVVVALSTDGRPQDVLIATAVCALPLPLIHVRG